MNIGRAFSFIFEDKNWLNKLLIPFFFCLIPIINFSVTGWGLKIARLVIQGKPVTPLPELNFAEDFIIGLKWLVITLVYALPIIVLSIVLAAVNVLTLVPVAVSSDSNSSIPVGLTIASVFAQLGLTGLLMIIALAYSFFLAAAAGNFSASDFEMGQGLNVKAAFGLIRASFVSYLLVFAAAALCSLLSMVGSAIFCVGTMAVTAYIIPVTGYLWGSAYREARNKLSAVQPSAA